MRDRQRDRTLRDDTLLCSGLLRKAPQRVAFASTKRNNDQSGVQLIFASNFSLRFFPVYAFPFVGLRKDGRRGLVGDVSNGGVLVRETTVRVLQRKDIPQLQNKPVLKVSLCLLTRARTKGSFLIFLRYHGVFPLLQEETSVNLYVYTYVHTFTQIHRHIDTRGHFRCVLLFNMNNSPT